MDNNEQISGKNWMLIWLLSVAGQLCWSIEGSWFNNFVYEKIAPNPAIVAWMVAISATTTTLATFLIGTWGDRVGKRRPYIAVGYILWGLFTIFYGVTEFLPKNPLILAAIVVVAADGIMSFFGSFGYHASFVPWTTDISNANNRGRVSAIIAIAPVIASILASVGAGIIIDALDFFVFFIIIGGLISLIGVLSLILLRDFPGLKPMRDEKGYWHQFFSVFKPDTVRKNKDLFWLFLLVVLYNIAFNVYFPYISIYLVNYIDLSFTVAGAVQGGCLLAAVLLTIPASRFIDKGKTFFVLAFSVAINIVGLVLIFIAAKVSFVVLCLGVFATGAGYVLNSQSYMAWFKNLLPEGSFGQFEGLRMLFSVCVPMIAGPVIATFVINKWGVPMVTDGIAGMVPSNALFGISAVLILSVLPVMIVLHRRRKSAHSEASAA